MVDRHALLEKVLAAIGDDDSAMRSVSLELKELKSAIKTAVKTVNLTTKPIHNDETNPIAAVHLESGTEL